MIVKKPKLKPMAHQAESLRHAEKNPRVLDLSDAGTGKTAVTIWDFARRRAAGGGAMLVLCPRSLMETVWADDIRKFAPHLRVVVAPAEKRQEAFDTPADVYITNHDATRWLSKQKKVFFKKFENGMLAVDELSFFKHHTSQRSIAAAAVAKYFAVRRGMTATPISLSVTDIWHQALLIDDGKLLGTEFYGFRNAVCEPGKQQSRDPRSVEWTDRDGAEEAVYGALSPISIRHKFEDCVDIPPTTFTEYAYKLPPKVRKLYDHMFRTHILEAKTHGLSSTIRAKNAGIAAQKLLQICSGAVYDNDKLTVELDRGRYELVMDLAQERKQPVIFYQWLHQRDMLLAEAKSRKLHYEVVDGTVSDSERKRIFAAYQARQMDGLIVHPDTVAHGVTLTAGNTIIWPGPIADIELFRQGNKRQARIGQKDKTEIILIHAENTREQEVFDILRTRDAKMAKLLALFETP